MQDWSKIISAGVGPIIVISACGLLCLAFYNRLAAVVTRLRAFQRERLHEQEALARQRGSEQPDAVATVKHQELLGALQVQTQHVIHRARMIRRTLFCLLLTIACLSLCSMAVGLSIMWPSLIYVAAPLFIVGLGLLLIGVIFAMVEMKYALDPVELESQFVTEMMLTMDRM
ncbi:MAG: DUF2721 domain-containing protein [Bacillota bacterium]